MSAQEPVWAALPCAVFAELLPSLSRSDYAALRCSCKSWHASLANTLQELAPVGPSPPGWAARFPALQRVDWSACICPVSDADLAQAGDLPRLAYLDCTPLENTKELSTLTDHGLAVLEVSACQPYTARRRDTSAGREHAWQVYLKYVFAARQSLDHDVGRHWAVVLQQLVVYLARELRLQVVGEGNQWLLSGAPGSIGTGFDIGMGSNC